MRAVIPFIIHDKLKEVLENQCATVEHIIFVKKHSAVVGACLDAFQTYHESFYPFMASLLHSVIGKHDIFFRTRKLCTMTFSLSLH